MFKRIVLLISLAVLLLGVAVTFAEDSNLITIPTKSYGNISFINDGRLNGADLAAPVAVYNKYDTVKQADGTWTTVFKGIELLSIDPKTNQGSLALTVSAADLMSKIDKSGHKDGVVLAEKNGFSLYYSKANWFWVTAPADKEGKVYSFQWQNFTVQHD
jgi:hypothetical protein